MQCRNKQNLLLRDQAIILITNQNVQNPDLLCHILTPIFRFKGLLLVFNLPASYPHTPWVRPLLNAISNCVLYRGLAYPVPSPANTFYADSSPHRSEQRLLNHQGRKSIASSSLLTQGNPDADAVVKRKKRLTLLCQRIPSHVQEPSSDAVRAQESLYIPVCK